MDPGIREEVAREYSLTQDYFLHPQQDLVLSRVHLGCFRPASCLTQMSIIQAGLLLCSLNPFKRTLHRIRAKVLEIIRLCTHLLFGAGEVPVVLAFSNIVDLISGSKLQHALVPCACACMNNTVHSDFTLQHVCVRVRVCVLFHLCVCVRSCVRVRASGMSMNSLTLVLPVLQSIAICSRVHSKVWMPTVMASLPGQNFKFSWARHLSGTRPAVPIAWLCTDRMRVFH